jgi:hypothetical protein
MRLSPGQRRIIQRGFGLIREGHFFLSIDFHKLVGIVPFLQWR